MSCVSDVHRCFSVPLISPHVGNDSKFLTCNDTERVCVVEWDPPEPEPFHQATGYERTPMPVGEERGKVVYCIDHGNFRHQTLSHLYFVRTNTAFVARDLDFILALSSPSLSAV